MHLSLVQQITCQCLHSSKFVITHTFYITLLRYFKFFPWFTITCPFHIGFITKNNMPSSVWKSSVSMQKVLSAGCGHLQNKYHHSQMISTIFHDACWGIRSWVVLTCLDTESGNNPLHLGRPNGGTCILARVCYSRPLDCQPTVDVLGLRRHPLSHTRTTWHQYILCHTQWQHDTNIDMSYQHGVQ